MQDREDFKEAPARNAADASASLRRSASIPTATSMAVPNNGSSQRVKEDTPARAHEPHQQSRDNHDEPRAGIENGLGQRQPARVEDAPARQGEIARSRAQSL